MLKQLLASGLIVLGSVSVMQASNISCPTSLEGRIDFFSFSGTGDRGKVNGLFLDSKGNRWHITASLSIKGVAVEKVLKQASWGVASAVSQHDSAIWDYDKKMYRCHYLSSKNPSLEYYIYDTDGE